MDFFKKLKETHPELTREFLEMGKGALLKQICAEVLDGLAMQERVATFMELCSNGLSKTNYTPEAIKEFVTKKQDEDIKDWCFEVCDESTDEEILEEIKKQASLSQYVKVRQAIGF